MKKSQLNDEKKKPNAGQNFYSLTKLPALFFVFSLLFCSTSYALAPFYQINLIVFQYNTPPSPSFETPLPVASHSKEIYLAPVTTTTPSHSTYEILPHRFSALKSTLRRLKRSDQITPVLNITWQQSFDESKIGKTIRIQAGIAYDNQGKQILLPISDASEIACRQIDGTIQINVNHFFYVHLNLSNTITLNETSYNNITPLKTFTLNQLQRMRSRKLYYFDSPAFGALIKIMPYTPPDIST
jgi:hypothetical protein